MFRYQLLEQQIRQQIESGQLAFGQRLPSVRLLCNEQGLSKSTVLTAYGRLEAAGWIEARPKSGYFVNYQPKTLKLPTSSEPDMAPSYITMDRLLVDTMNHSAAFDILPGQGAAEPNEVLRRALARAARRQSSQEQHYYDEPAGLVALREQLLKRCSDGGSQASVEQLIVTNGCQHALLLSLMATTQPGDAVAVESPGFYGVLQLIEALGLKAVEVPSSPVSGVSPDALEQAISSWPIKAVVLTPSFATPTGASMPDQNKIKVLELLHSRSIVLIEDDIYGDLTFSLQRPRSLYSYAQTLGLGPVILCSSFSKSLSRDLRIGWVLTDRYQRRIQQLKLVTQLASSRTSQLALAMFLAEGSYDRYLRQRRQQLAEQCRQLQQLIGQLFPSAVGCSQPQGGLCLWLELPPQVDTLALYNLAQQQGIAITPGGLFTSQKRYQHCLRISFAHPWCDTRIAALRNLAELIEQQL